MKILYIVVDELPKSCLDCIVHMCHLPLNSKRENKVLKKYLTTRHKECPLRLESKGEQK